MDLGNLFRHVRSNRVGFLVGKALLSTGFIVNNPLYQYFYKKRIRKTVYKKENSPPSIIEIGITNACNSNCIMCPHHKLKKFGFMDMKLYNKIIDDAHSLGIKNVSLSFFGEAMLDRNLNDRIKYAKSKGMQVGFFSNVALMDEKKAQGIIESGLDSITISFDSNRKEVYEKIRKNLKFEKTRENILRLLHLKKKMGKKNPSISLVVVLMDENADELKSFYKFWEPRVDGINIINMRNWSGEIEKDSKKSFHYQRNLVREPCSLLWQSLMIDWDGEVVLCCNDYAHEVVLGDLKKESIMDVWNGKKLRGIRELHLSGNASKIDFCRKCNKRSVWW